MFVRLLNVVCGCAVVSFVPVLFVRSFVCFFRAVSWRPLPQSWPHTADGYAFNIMKGLLSVLVDRQMGTYCMHRRFIVLFIVPVYDLSLKFDAYYSIYSFHMFKMYYRGHPHILHLNS